VVIAGVISARPAIHMVQKLPRHVGNAVQTAVRTAGMAVARTAFPLIISNPVVTLYAIIY
jgi:hypothetical protein